MRHTRASLSRIVCLVMLMAPTLALAQTPPQAATPATAPAQPAANPISDAQIAQAVAPVALYPDTLLSQILMAATYPVEIVEADRWLQANPTLKDDALALALENQSWDPSVKSLVNFPSVLKMLSDNLSTTSLLGDAFLADQKRVMAAVQKLRAQAKDAGNLSTNTQQTVTTEQVAADASSPTGTTNITIAPADPEQIYVPTYDPNYVYGYWPYTAYAPYYYNPGYAYTVGFRHGVAWGYAWGHCNWGHNPNIAVNVNQNINDRWAIDRTQYNNYYANNANFKNGQGTWQHNPAHRDGVAYRDQATSNRFSAYNSSNRETQARQAYRGRENTPTQAQASQRQAEENRQREARAQEYRQQEARSQQARSTAISDYNRGSHATRQAAQRGNASRGYSRPAQHSGGGGGGRRR